MRKYGWKLLLPFQDGSFLQFFCCRTLCPDPVFSASPTVSNSRSRLTGVNWLADTFHSRKRCTCYANRVSCVPVKRNVMFTIGLPRMFQWINLKISSRCAGWLLMRTRQGKVHAIMIIFPWNESDRMFEPSQVFCVIAECRLVNGCFERQCCFYVQAQRIQQEIALNERYCEKRLREYTIH